MKPAPANPSRGPASPRARSTARRCSASSLVRRTARKTGIAARAVNVEFPSNVDCTGIQVWRDHADTHTQGTRLPRQPAGVLGAHDRRPALCPPGSGRCARIARCHRRSRPGWRRQQPHYDRLPSRPPTSIGGGRGMRVQSDLRAPGPLTRTLARMARGDDGARPIRWRWRPLTGRSRRPVLRRDNVVAVKSRRSRHESPAQRELSCRTRGRLRTCDLWLRRPIRQGSRGNWRELRFPD